MSKFYLILISFVVLSCVNDETSNYLFNHLKEPLNSSKSYYIIDMSGCDSCIENNLEFLLKEEVDLTLVIVGEIHSKRWDTAIDRIDGKYIIIYDKDRMALRIGLRLPNPLLIITQLGNVILQRNIKDSQLDTLLEYDD